MYGTGTAGGYTVSASGGGPRNRSVGASVKQRFLGLDRWAQVATVLALPVAALGTIASLAALGGGITPKPTPSTPVPSVPVAVTTPATVSSSTPASTQNGIPSADLGSWGGFVRQNNGLTERFLLTLTQGGPGQQVGTFSNQTANCQGEVFLNGDTTVTMSGQTVPAADLDLETTQDPAGDCTSSVEAYVASVTGSDLVYEVITAGSVQGSFQSPLALGNLSH